MLPRWLNTILEDDGAQQCGRQTCAVALWNRAPLRLCRLRCSTPPKCRASLCMVICAAAMLAQDCEVGRPCSCHRCDIAGEKWTGFRKQHRAATCDRGRALKSGRSSADSHRPGTVQVLTCPASQASTVGCHHCDMQAHLGPVEDAGLVHVVPHIQVLGGALVRVQLELLRPPVARRGVQHVQVGRRARPAPPAAISPPSL